MIEITLPIKPQSKQRPRSGRGRIYTAEKTRIFESKIRSMTSHLDPLSGPLVLDSTFVFKRPKKMSKKLIGRQPRLGTPDVDNLLKALSDGLQGSLIDDDSCFIEMSGRKVYGAIDEDDAIELRIFPYDINKTALHARAIGSPKHRILAALSKGLSQKVAASHGPISPATFYRWRKEDEDFNEQVQKAIGVGEYHLFKELRQAAEESKDWRAYAWILEHRFPEQYSSKRLYNDGGVQLNITTNGQDLVAEKLKEVEAIINSKS